MKKRILTVVIVTLLVIGALVTVAFAQTSATALDIGYASLSLEEDVRVNFKVSYGSAVAPDEIKLLVWEGTPADTDYTVSTLGATVLSPVDEQVIGGVTFKVFQYKDVAAKEMGKTLYARAYWQNGGATVYSEPVRYSVAQYLDSQIKIENNKANPDTAYIALLENIRAYGASSQAYFANKGEDTGVSVSNEICAITVSGGKLADGFASAKVLKGDKITLIADAVKEGEKIFGWKMTYTDESGNPVEKILADSAKATVETEVTANATYSLVIAGSSEPQKLTVNWNSGYIQSDHGDKVPEIKSSSAYVYSDIITVPHAGTKISFTDANPDFAGRGIYVISSWTDESTLDTAGINISGSSASGSPIAYPSGVTTRTSVTYEYITSKDNEKIRLCLYEATGPDVYMTEYAGIGTYQEYLDFIEDSTDSVYNEKLEGITMALFGDSYLAGNRLRGEYTWASMLADKYDMTLYNHAIGGSTISDRVTTHTPLVLRWDNDCGDPSIIVIEGGRNDSSQSIPIGSVEDGSTQTFCGALKFMLRNLRAKYPDAMIVGITSYNSVDNPATIKYAQAMKQLFEHYGFPCIYAADPAVSGVDTSTETFRDQYMELPTDYSHLNYRGHMMALPYFEAAMTKCYVDFLDGKYDEKEVDDGGFSVNWNSGFVGSDLMGNNEDWKLVPKVDPYIYTDVITIPKAGTTIYFRDCTKTEGTTSTNVFIFSSWKKDGDNWVIDRNGINLRSDQATIKEKGSDYIVWTYTTTKDNENLRLCIRAKDDPTLVSVTSNEGLLWNSGFINNGAIGTDGSFGASPAYTYSDVFTVPKAGTTIYFRDYITKEGVTSTNVYIFSSWKFENGAWVIDKSGVNVRSNEANRKSATNDYIEWSYTTTKDNEHLRICIRCADDPTSIPVSFGEGILWNSGYIHSGTIGTQGAVGGSAVHAYTDVFTVEKAGTKVYFVDLGDVSTNGAYYIFSSWKKDASGNWVFDAAGTNLASNVASVEMTPEGYGIWSYTTKKDNENLRAGLRCEKDPTLPTIQFEYPQ